MFNFLRLPNCLLTVAAQFYIPTSNESSNFFISPLTLVIYLKNIFFYYSHLPNCEVVSHCGFAHPFLFPQILASLSSKELEERSFSPTTSQNCLKNKSVNWYVYTSQYHFRPYR